MSPEDIKTWICPNDRQLLLRAKLGTGWSFHTGRANRCRPEQLSGEEMDHIIRVVKRSELLEEIDKKRIGVLVDRVENMKSLASGNGTTECWLCALEFTILNRSSSRACDDCTKIVCSKCGVYSLLHHCQQQLWLCKICSEKRELWKRSGAWFYNSLPNYYLSSCLSCRELPRNDAVAESPTVQENGKSTALEPPNTSRRGSITTTYTRVKPRRSSSSSESEYSIEGNDASPSADQTPQATPQIVISTPEPAADVPDHSPTPASPVPSSPIPANPPPMVSEGPQRVGGFRSSPSSVKPKSSGKMTLLAKAQGHRAKIIPSEETKEEEKELPLKQSGVIKVPGLSEFGYLEFSVFFDAVNSQLSVKVIQATDLRPMDPNGLSDPYVKLHLLPGGDHRTKRRTKTIQKTLNPVWNEELIYYGLTVGDMLRKVLRLSVLDEDLMTSDWIGEYRQPLQEVAPNCHLHLQVPLHCPRKLLPREISNNKSSRGRILIALCLNHPAGTITVDIVRCAELLAKDANGYSDPYVKVQLLPDLLKKNKRKTCVKLKTLNPSFNEEFIFKVDPKAAIGSTLDIQVWDCDFGAKDDYIGGIQLGLNARGELLRQWYDMFTYPGKRLERWHPLAKLKH